MQMAAAFSACGLFSLLTFFFPGINVSLSSGFFFWPFPLCLLLQEVAVPDQ